MRSTMSQTGHNIMVKKAVQRLQSLGYYDIKADIAGFRKPEIIRWSGNANGHIPDVTAIGNSKLYVFEVETVGSINDSHTSDQWTLFAAYAKENSNVEFWVIVPRGSKYAAQLRLSNLGITAHIWEM